MISFLAISDGENGSTYNKSALLRKNSSKNNLPQNALVDEMVRLAQDYSKYKLIIDTIKGKTMTTDTLDVSLYPANIPGSFGPAKEPVLDQCF